MERDKGDGPFDELVRTVRYWRNHWAEVHRVALDFPEDIRQVLALRPTEPREALEQTTAQLAVLFNPEATAELVDQLDAVMRTIDKLNEQRH